MILWIFLALLGVAVLIAGGSYILDGALWLIDACRRNRHIPGRILATTLLEIRLNLLSPGPWIMGLVLAALGFLRVRTATEASSFQLAWALASELGPLSVVLLLFLSASLAHRPERYDVSELIDSKVVGSEELIFGRWIGMVVAVLVPVLIQFAVTMAGQKIISKFPVLPLPYLTAFVRLLPSILFLCTLSFCLVAVTRILVLGAGLAGLFWFIYNFGKNEYPTVFRMELAQNRYVFFGLAAAVLLWMLLGYRGRRRAKRAPITYGLATLTGLLATFTLVYAAWVALAVPSKASVLETWRRLKNPEADRELQRPDLNRSDPLPDFAWLDQHGERVSLARLRGKPALIVFVQPKDDGLIALLGRLARLRRELAKQELEVLVVCISQDLDIGGEAARAAGVDLPIATDWGQLSNDAFNVKEPPSMAAWVLRVQGTFSAILVDSAGKERARDLPLDDAHYDELKEKVRTTLEGES